jgi:biopolymer transport protein ExbB
MADLRRKIGFIAAGAVVLALLAVPMGLAFAGEPTPATPAAAAPAPAGGATSPAGVTGAGKSWGWWDVIKSMGSCGIVIVLLSVAGLALIIDFAVNIRREKLVPQDIVSELEQLFEQEQYEQAMELCDAEDCFFTRICGAGLAKLGAGYERMTEAVQEAGEEEITALNQKIGWLSLIGTVAPMLGLLGTVIGMIEAFSKIASMAGAAGPAELAVGISKALVTTLMGLMVAIPVLSAYTFFKNRVTRVMLEVGVITGDLLDRFRPVQ